MPIARLGAALALAALLAACGSDSPTSPSAEPPVAALTVALDSSTLQGGSLFSARLRGPRLDSLRAITIGGVSAVGGLRDSTLVAMLPAGPAGSLPLVVEVWSGNQPRSATVTITRRASATVTDPAAAITAAQTNLSDAMADLESRTPAAGITPEAYAAQLAEIRVLQDSLADMLAGFSAQERQVFAELLAGYQAIDAQANAASLREAFNTESCSAFTWLDARECLRRLGERLSASSLSTQKKLAYSIGLVAIGLLAFTAAPLVAVASIALGLYIGIENRQQLADFATAKMEAVTAPAIIEELGFGSSDARLGSASANSVSGDTLTFYPGSAQTLPLVRVSRNAVLADSTLPIVEPLPPLVQALKDYWQQIEQALGLSPTATPSFPTQTLRELRETPALSELSVLSVRENGQPAANVTATLQASAGGIALRLDGEPGDGRNLVVALRLNGEDAGSATRELPLRFVAPTDTLDWAAQVLTTGTWNLQWQVGIDGEMSLCSPRFVPGAEGLLMPTYRPGRITLGNRTEVYDAATDQSAPAYFISYSVTCDYPDGAQVESNDNGIAYLYWLQSAQGFRVLRVGAAGEPQFLEFTATRLSFQYVFNGQVDQRWTFTR